MADKVKEMKRMDSILLSHLQAKNRKWAEDIKAQDPAFFETLSKQQTPQYLWIGCADSRVPANQILGLAPGEVFVHRNIANQVLHTDINALSVIQYAVEYLKVKHIIVCGHYGCGGVGAAYDHKSLGLIDNWLGPIKDTYHNNREEVDAMPDKAAKIDRLCELNVMRQVKRLATTSIVQQAWRRGQNLVIHGFIYGLNDGIMKPLYCDITGPEDVEEDYHFVGPMHG